MNEGSGQHRGSLRLPLFPIEFIRNELEGTLNKKKRVTLQTAGRQLKIEGIIVVPSSLTLGNQSYKEKVYVAPIGDEMLLGLEK